MMRYHKYFYRNARMRNRMSTLKENNGDKTVILIMFRVDKEMLQEGAVRCPQPKQTPCPVGFNDIR